MEWNDLILLAFIKANQPQHDGSFRAEVEVVSERHVNHQRARFVPGDPQWTGMQLCFRDVLNKNESEKNMKHK